MTFAQRLRQPVRHHLEVEEVPGPVRSSRTPVSCRLASALRLKVRSTNLNCLTPRSSRPSSHSSKASSGDLPHWDVQRRKAKLAGERAAARGFDVNDTVRDVLLVVKLVRQRELGELGQPRGDDLGGGPFPASSCRQTSANFKSASPVMT